MENNIASLVRRAADRCGFQRERFIEDDTPTTSSNILVLPFFGNLASCSIFSQFVLHRHRELFPHKYLILASWPGLADFFPEADEYWSPRDEASLRTLASHSEDFSNHSDLFTEFNRFLVNHFENVISYDDFRPFYDHGFGTKFWEKLRIVRSFLPEVPSPTKLTEDIRIGLGRPGRKIVIHPARRLRSWQGGRCVHLPVHRDFWAVLIERLLKEGFIPAVQQNWFTYDLSPDFADRCLWLTSKDSGRILSGLRATGCALDIFTGFSRIAAAARTPCLIVDERQRYVAHRGHELEDLTQTRTPRQYVFSFSTQLMTGGADEWNLSLLDGIVSRLERWLPTLHESSWGSTAESCEDMDYDIVRKQNQMRLGVKFIRKY